MVVLFLHLGNVLLSHKHLRDKRAISAMIISTAHSVLQLAPTLPATSQGTKGSGGIRRPCRHVSCCVEASNCAWEQAGQLQPHLRSSQSGTSLNAGHPKNPASHTRLRPKHHTTSHSHKLNWQKSQDRRSNKKCLRSKVLVFATH